MNAEPFPLAVLILAAGESTRMGCPKALLPLGKQLFLTHILSNPYLQKKHVYAHVVLGHEPENLMAYIPKCVPFSIHPDYAQGRTTSIQCGLRELGVSVDGFFLLPVDCPLVEADVFEALSASFGNEHAICIPTCRRKRGHPPLIGRVYFDEIAALGGDESLRSIYVRHAERIIHVPVERESILHNINTPEEYELVLSNYRSKQGESQ